MDDGDSRSDVDLAGFWLLPVGGQIDDDTAEQGQGGQGGNQDQQTHAGIGKRRGPQGFKMKREGLGKLRKPGEPAEAMARLIGKKYDHEEQIDGQGEDLRAEDGPADALDRGLAAAELSAPPEDAGRSERRCGG
jgi:hypothetical protein